MVRTTAVVLAACGLMLAGCEEKPSGTAPATTKTATDKAAGALKDAGKTVTDAGKAAVDKAKEAGTAAVDKAKEAGAAAADQAKAGLEAIKADATKWVSETVEKQWPAMKDQVTKLEGAVAGIKDPAIKTRVEDGIKSLKAQMPAIEELVTKIKAAAPADLGGLMDQAKKAWDGFAAKLKDVQSMIPAMPGGAK